MTTTEGPDWTKQKERLQRSWDKLVFGLALRRETVVQHDAVLAEAEAALARRDQHEGEAACLASPDPVVRQGWALKQQVEAEFRNRYAGRTDERVLIHVPGAIHSPAGYSLFTNLAESLEFIGVPTRMLEWDADTGEVLEAFRPTVLLSSDDEAYRSRIDWAAIARYKQAQRLRVGLTASLEEYGNSPLAARLAWARQSGVDFYYTFRDEDYVRTRSGYRPFFDAGYPMVYLPFGANILHYYSVAGFERDLDYVIMATRKAEHMSHMKGIVGRYTGFIDGPGWKHVHDFRFNRERDRYIYARARVGLNVHLPEQLQWACEVNERTYQLAACGVPQLVDHALLLDKLFGPESLFIAETPAQYRQLFREIIAEPDRTRQRALQAQREVMAAHTTFHRAEAFVCQLTHVPERNERPDAGAK